METQIVATSYESPQVNRKPRASQFESKEGASQAGQEQNNSSFPNARRRKSPWSSKSYKLRGEAVQGFEVSLQCRSRLAPLCRSPSSEKRSLNAQEVFNHSTIIYVNFIPRPSFICKKIKKPLKLYVSLDSICGKNCLLIHIIR